MHCLPLYQSVTTTEIDCNIYLDLRSYSFTPFMQGPRGFLVISLPSCYENSRFTGLYFHYETDFRSKLAKIVFYFNKIFIQNNCLRVSYSCNKLCQEIVHLVAEKCQIKEGDSGFDVPLRARQLAVASVITRVHSVGPLCVEYFL